MTAARAPSAPFADSPGPRVSLETVLENWWPLAASWLLMGFELPAVSAALARLPDPDRSLAAYGGVVFPLALLIESPILMLLAASTALSRDLHSYRVGRRFMLALGLGFTALHGLVAFTPLFDVIAARWLKVPAEILEPSRLGLRIMLPWTVSIAFRRFHQGVLIRFGQARSVGAGTAVRLTAMASVLGFGLTWRHLPGIVVGTCAVISGVVSEALFAFWRVRPILAGPLRQAPAVSPPLDSRRFARFYFPLMITPLFYILSMPLASAAMSRMDRPLESLAAWPVLNGLVFTLRSTGFALNEVVVAMLDRPGAAAALRRFAALLAATTSSLLLIAAVTPIGHWWFASVSALAPALATLGASALWVAAPMPGLAALQSLYQGTLVHAHRTRGVTESVIAYFVVAAAVMVSGPLVLRHLSGLYVAIAGMAAGNAAQWLWLATRARGLDRPAATPPTATPRTPAG